MSKYLIKSLALVVFTTQQKILYKTLLMDLILSVKYYDSAFTSKLSGF